MVKKLMIAVAMVALMAVPSFAAVQNVKVGGSLKTTSVIRGNFDLGASGFSSDGGDNSNTVQDVIMSQVKLDVSADLTDNVSTTLRLTNERLWGTNQAGIESGSGGDVQGSAVRLDTAYITMKEFFYSPLSVTLGRQPLKYGNQLIIGDGDGTTDVADVTDISGGVNFDALKAVLTYDPLVVDLFAAKTMAGNTTANGDDDADLYGINANYKLGGDMNVVLEAYTFAKIDKTNVNSSDAKAQKLYVPGLRVSLNPLEGLGLQFEGAYERGNGGADQTLNAYALQGMFTFALPVKKDLKMGLSGGYTYLSGDKEPGNDNKNNAWQPVYENQWTGRIFDALFTNSNMGVTELAFEMVPMTDLTTKVSFYDIRQVRKNHINDNGYDSDYINQPDSNGSVEVDHNSNHKQLGEEFDLDVKYAYTEDVTLGLSAGIFKPGKAFGTENQENATQVLSSVNVLF